ncbi:MAG TPA: hypothetical protein VNH18_15400, partial [Bryobacteraceae bacterium]|nr:hypothetical protein [Bryobacteraceae bacterium]
MLGSIFTLVAFLTDHLKVEDWPRWIDEGVAANIAIAGRGGGGAVSFVVGSGGGGGTDATFFLQADANNRKQNPSASRVIF